MVDAVCEPFMSLDHDYPDRHVSLSFFLVTNWTPQPHGREGQRLKWVNCRELGDEDLLPADKPVVDALVSRY